MNRTQRLGAWLVVTALLVLLAYRWLTLPV